MEIRADFHSVLGDLSHLVVMANAFRSLDQDWSHHKNREDFRSVYGMANDDREAFERLYATGRDIEISMRNELVAFNDPSNYPTLRSFVDHFDGFEDQFPFLSSVCEEAKQRFGILRHPWAVSQMILLFEKQMHMLNDVAATMKRLKASNLYKCGTSTLPAHNFGGLSANSVIFTIDLVGRRFESLPDSYKGRSEEGMRDLFLVTLEGRFPGIATGETFNMRGKTDILVKSGSENILIVECKIWHGQAQLGEAIDQLLGNLSLRDEQSALLVFVQNVGFMDIVEKAFSAVADHPNYVSLERTVSNTWREYKFSSVYDQKRIVGMSVMLYSFR